MAELTAVVLPTLTGLTGGRPSDQRVGDGTTDSTELGERWERLVRADSASGFMQSLGWASFKRRQGFRVEHLGLLEDGRLIGGMIGYAAPTGTTLLVAPEGPVLPWADEERARISFRMLIKLAEQTPLGADSPDAARASRLTTASDSSVNLPLALRVEPRLEPPRPRLLRDFGRAPVDLLPTETLYLDLTPEPAALLAAMHPKGRYNIRLAERRGVIVREEIDPASARQFHAVVAEAGARDGFFVEPPRFFGDLADTLFPIGLARFLFAEDADGTLGALLLVIYGRRATYLYGGIANRRREAMAGYALQWAAIRRARELGCREYDFYGYEPFGAPDHLYAGFSRFKRQFGGRPVRFIGAHERFFLDRLVDEVVRVAARTG